MVGSQSIQSGAVRDGEKPQSRLNKPLTVTHSPRLSMSHKQAFPAREIRQTTMAHGYSKGTAQKDPGAHTETNPFWASPGLSDC